MKSKFNEILLMLFSVWNGVVSLPLSQLNDEDSAMSGENYNDLQNAYTSATLNTRDTKSKYLLTLENTGLKNSVIDDTPIKERATDRPIIVKERAFVYLNQKYKTPIQKQVYDLHMQEVNVPLKNIKSWTKSQFSKISKNPLKTSSFFQPSLYQIVGAEAKQMEFYDGATNENKVKNTDSNYNTDTNINKLEKHRNYLELHKKPTVRNPYNKKQYEKANNMKYEKYIDKNGIPVSQFNEDASVRDDGIEIFDGYENQIQDEIMTSKPQLNSIANQDYINDQADMKVFFNKEEPGLQLSIGNQNCNLPDCIPDKHFRGKHYSKTRLRKPHKAGCDCNRKKVYDHDSLKESFGRDRERNKKISTHSCQTNHDTSIDVMDNELQNSVNILNRTLQMYR